MFRIPSTSSVVNRYGFNSEGHQAVIARLRDRIHAFLTRHAYDIPSSLFPIMEAGSSLDLDPVTSLLATPLGAQANVIDAMHVPRSLRDGKVLAINLGKNKVSEPASVDDFVSGTRQLGPYADVLVVNVSSPNTPGLRSLQRRGMFEELLGEVVKARDGLKS